MSSVSQGEYETFTKPLPDQKGRNITAPDFRKDRQRAMAKELLRPKYQAYGFKTADLLKSMPEHFRNPTQIRYEMNKLKVRGVIEKVKNKSFYVVTEKGWIWLWLEICSHHHFKNPMISKTLKNDLRQISEQPSLIEQAYDLIHRGLSQFTSQLALIS